MVKQIDCQFITSQQRTENIEVLLDNSSRHAINNLLWSNNNYFPQAAFSMAYTDHSILLKYFVKEKYPVARHTQINDLVYKDSCVEFFVSFDNGVNYYNLEFNCIGVCYGAYGAGRHERGVLPADDLRRIKVDTHAQELDYEGFAAWELTLEIPFTVFSYNDITSLTGTQCIANFYKCGDETPMPHYLSWNNILSTEPNFHAPEYFGIVKFK